MSEKPEELLKKVQESREAQTRFEQVKKDVPRWHVFLYQLLHAVDYVLSKYLPPVRWLMFKLFKWYRALWAFFVYKRNDENVLIFSKARAGIFLVVSSLYLWYGLVPTFTLAVDTGLYFATVKHDETVYLSFSQEIDPENDIHSIKGSEDLVTDDTNGFYYRVEPSLFNQLWAITHKGNLFYPDYVASAVPAGNNNICTVTSYGIRLKSFMRRMNIYPQMLSASCRPIGVVK